MSQLLEHIKDVIGTLFVLSSPVLAWNVILIRRLLEEQSKKSKKIKMHKNSACFQSCSNPPFSYST